MSDKPAVHTYDDFEGDIEKYIIHAGHEVMVFYSGTWTQTAVATLDGNVRVTKPDMDVAEVEDVTPFCVTCGVNLHADGLNLSEYYQIL